MTLLPVPLASAVGQCSHRVERPTLPPGCHGYYIITVPFVGLGIFCSLRILHYGGWRLTRIDPTHELPAPTPAEMPENHLEPPQPLESKADPPPPPGGSI